MEGITMYKYHKVYVDSTQMGENWKEQPNEIISNPTKPHQSQPPPEKGQSMKQSCFSLCPVCASCRQNQMNAIGFSSAV